MQPVILRAQSPDIKQTSMLAHTAVIAAATLPLPTVASPATPPETTEDDDDEPDKENLKLEQRYSSSTTTTINIYDERLVPYELIIRLLETVCFEDPSFTSFSAAILIFMPGLGEIRRLNDMLAEHPLFGSENQFRIHPLHSTLSSEHQGAVFDVPPAGIRKIVIGACNFRSLLEE